jgi:hypothetical protein
LNEPKGGGEKKRPSEWIAVDLGVNAIVNRIELDWNVFYATNYFVRISEDGTSWITVFSTGTGSGGSEATVLPDIAARGLRLHSTAWNSNSFRIWLNEIRIYGYRSELMPARAFTQSTAFPIVLRYNNGNSGHPSWK